jgi:hypothetical protein
MRFLYGLLLITVIFGVSVIDDHLIKIWGW